MDRINTITSKPTTSTPTTSTPITSTPITSAGGRHVPAVFTAIAIRFVVVVATMLWVGQTFAQSADELSQQASWRPFSYAGARDHILAWTQSRNLDELTGLKVDTLWPEIPSGSSDSQSNLLDRVGETLRVVEPSCSEMLDYIAVPARDSSVPDFAVLHTSGDEPFIDQHLRLMLGRWLCQNGYYDEVIEQLSNVQIEQVVDPAALYFYRGIAFHRLLSKDESIEALETLLENQDAIPVRYRRVADLMLVDLRPLEADTLDEIARLMEDVRRRQSLHRSGTRVREEEQQVVDKLTKLIKELEDRGGGPPPPGDAGSGGSKPMDESRPGGGIGPGNVDRRANGPGSDWGGIPARDRAGALAGIAKDLPAHYREVIEEYFKQLAKED